MCFSHDERPPELPEGLPRMAGAAAAEILELQSADGTAFSAAIAQTTEVDSHNVLILPDVRGLSPFFIALAERFAEAGHHAVVIDYFGRTAGLGPREEDFEYGEHVPQTRVPQVQADAAAALEALREQTGVTTAVSVGFCFGGYQSFVAATSAELDLVGAVGFYGILDGGRFGGPSPIETAGEVRCPVLGLFGGADQAIPIESVERYDAALETAQVEHEVVVYPGAPHSFFSKHAAEYADASEDAWRRTLDFAGRVGEPAAS